MFPAEIVIAETTPETEGVRGRALQKTSSTYWHGLVQRRVSAGLGTWAETNATGRVASEWRFRVTPPGQITRPLVPDVAFVSYARLPKDAAPSEIGIPFLAPDLAVEITSPDDRADDVRDKIDTYLRSGTRVVLVIDPMRQTAFAHYASGERAFDASASFVHAAFEGLAIPIASLFEEI